MADYFSSLPNFVNPQYATPEQLANQRAYADALTKRSGENVNRPAGAFANMITALTANLERNRANEIQRQAAEGNARNFGDVIAQLQNGQKIDPQNLGHIIANPLVSPEQRALALKLMSPEGVADVYGRPGFASPAAGVQVAPVSGGFQPGFRAPETAGSVSTTTPFPAPGVSPAGPRMPVASTPRVWGDKEAEAAGLYPPSPNTAPQALGSGGGGQATGAGSPPAPAPAASVGSRIDALAAKDRELTAKKELTQAGAGAEGSVIKTDVDNAATAPDTLKGLGIIKDNIQRFGNKITFGPTSPFTNEVKRIAANYAPGFMKDSLGAIAAADSIEKVNLGLAGSLAKQIGSGTQGELFRAMGSVPGMEKSKEGALALIDMLQQSAIKQQALGQLYQQSKGDLGAYQAARERYLTEHPVVNPLTGNPIEMDLAAMRKNQGAAAGAPAPGGPQVGAVHNGYRFKGGNPNNKESWEPVR